MDKYIYDENNGLWYELQPAEKNFFPPIDFLICSEYNKSCDLKHLI